MGGHLNSKLGFVFNFGNTTTKKKTDGGEKHLEVRIREMNFQNLQLNINQIIQNFKWGRLKVGVKVSKINK